jgi:hypothetical protein
MRNRSDLSRQHRYVTEVSPRPAAEDSTPAPDDVAANALRIIHLWDELASTAPDPALCITYLARRANVSRADVERLRDVRNRCAHPAERGLPNADELRRTLITARRIADRLQPSPPAGH